MILKLGGISIPYAALLLLLAMMHGCGGKDSEQINKIELKSISVDPQTVSIFYGQTRQFRAIGAFSDNSTRDMSSDVTWTSSDDAVATVDAQGLATATFQGGFQGMVQGTAAITATFLDFSLEVSGQASVFVFDGGIE